jgi:hypothetical protein
VSPYRYPLSQKVHDTPNGNTVPICTVTHAVRKRYSMAAAPQPHLPGAAQPVGVHVQRQSWHCRHHLQHHQFAGRAAACAQPTVNLSNKPHVNCNTCWNQASTCVRHVYLSTTAGLAVYVQPLRSGKAPYNTDCRTSPAAPAASSATAKSAIIHPAAHAIPPVCCFLAQLCPCLADPNLVKSSTPPISHGSWKGSSKATCQHLVDRHRRHVHLTATARCEVKMQTLLWAFFKHGTPSARSQHVPVRQQIPICKQNTLTKSTEPIQ